MTFTPPKEYPATYEQGGGIVTIHGWFEDRYIGVWRHDYSGTEVAGMWNEYGFDLEDGSDQLEDISKRREVWMNIYPDGEAVCHDDLDEAKGSAGESIIARVRVPWVEGQFDE